LLRQDAWAKKAGASSRTPENRGETPFGVRRLAAAFAGTLKPQFLFEVGVCGRMMATIQVSNLQRICDFDPQLAKECK
jgi:hypothetical protein